MGPRAGLPGNRHRRHRALRSRGAPAALARGRPPRRHGVHGAPRHRAIASRGARAGHAARHLGAHELLARRRAMRTRPSRDPARAYVSRYALGRDYHKVLRARLAQPRRSHCRRGRAVRLPRVHRQRAGARSRARREGRPRVARQAHAAPDARRGLVLLPGRDLHRPAAARDARRDRALRHVHARASPRAPPAPSSRRTSSMRAAAFRISRSSTTARSPRRCVR